MVIGRPADALPLLQELSDKETPGFDPRSLLNCAAKLDRDDLVMQTCERLASGEPRTYPPLLAPGFQREVREMSETQSLLRHSGDRRSHGFASGETSPIASARTDARYAMRLDAFSYDEQTRGHKREAILSVYGLE
jgi:hypothetical protein